MTKPLPVMSWQLEDKFTLQQNVDKAIEYYFIKHDIKANTLHIKPETLDGQGIVGVSKIILDTMVGKKEIRVSKE